MTAWQRLIKLNAKTTLNAAVREAQGLVSAGENPEYDRALVELVAYAFGGGQDDFLAVSVAIFGVERPDLWASPA